VKFSDATNDDSGNIDYNHYDDEDIKTMARKIAQVGDLDDSENSLSKSVFQRI
jgi:hypothetical protein